MKLKQHIKENFNGNVSAFAREYGTTRQQSERWLEYKCIIIDGEIYKPVVKADN